MSMNEELSKKTSIFGIRLWVLIGIAFGAVIVFLLSLYFTTRKKYKKNQNLSLKTQKFSQKTQNLSLSCSDIPNVSKEIKMAENPEADIENDIISENSGKKWGENVKFGKKWGESVNNEKMRGESEKKVKKVGGEVSHLGWGHWYTLRELEESSNGFSDDNVIGEGGYGIVYKAVLNDGSILAVKNLLNNRRELQESSNGYSDDNVIGEGGYGIVYKAVLNDGSILSVNNLLNNRGQAENEFKVEVEAIGRVRHKNLVRLLGYCVEGAHRMLVYEYVDNGNLEQWLHGDVGPCSPLTWDLRMNILLGAAKGLTYLHEGLEPKVVHRDIKSSNILLDRQWNAKLSDFGLAKLLGSERNYVTTRVMGTFGYVAPEYASTGMLNERSDVYSFGILIMEIISGRNPVDYSRPPGEVNLVEWLKTMISSKNTEGVLDPKMLEKPPSRALKRALLVALRCVDPNAQKRPKMSQVIHMLEADDFPFRDDRRSSREQGRSPRERLTERCVMESGDSSGYESGAQANRAPWRKRELEDVC